MFDYLVYVSTAVRELSDDELSYLVSRAASRNAAEGVTGLLLYSQGDFIQCIEGPPLAVDRIFQVIQADPQHRGIITLAQGKSKERDFCGLAHGFQVA